VSEADAPPRTSRGARLVYLMGASGSGKDTVLRLLARLPHAGAPVLVAHRYITRGSDAHEASVPLDPREFARRAALGCFALHWDSHGLRYGVGIEIDAWMARGAMVIVNGSRIHLTAAHARYPALCAVHLAVDPAALERRLIARGRETPRAIAERLERAQRPFDVPEGCDLRRLDNSGAPEAAAARLLDWIHARDTAQTGA